MSETKASKYSGFLLRCLRRGTVCKQGGKVAQKEISQGFKKQIGKHVSSGVE